MFTKMVHDHGSAPNFASVRKNPMKAMQQVRQPLPSTQDFSIRVLSGPSVPARPAALVQAGLVCSSQVSRRVARKNRGPFCSCTRNGCARLPALRPQRECAAARASCKRGTTGGQQLEEALHMGAAIAGAAASAGHEPTPCDTSQVLALSGASSGRQASQYVPPPCLLRSSLLAWGEWKERVDWGRLDRWVALRNVAVQSQL